MDDSFIICEGLKTPGDEGFPCNWDHLSLYHLFNIQDLVSMNKSLIQILY